MMRTKTLAWAFLMTALMALIAMFAGCTKPEVRYVQVNVPVAVPCPEPPQIYWPDLSVKRLTKESTDSQVVKAYAADWWFLQGRLAEALGILNGYRTNTPATAIPKVGK